MMKRLTTKTTVYLALLTAMTVAIGMVLQIPNPISKGVIVLLDMGIFVAGILFGSVGGGLVGGLSGLLFDVLSGYSEWAIWSFIIHGVQGLLFGSLYRRNKYVAFVVSNVFMLVGYAIATGIMYGMPEAIASLPGNIVQVTVSIAVTLFLAPHLHKISRRIGGQK